jgi:hypothetical protein
VANPDVDAAFANPAVRDGGVGTVCWVVNEVGRRANDILLGRSSDLPPLSEQLPVLRAELTRARAQIPNSAHQFADSLLAVLEEVERAGGQDSVAQQRVLESLDLASLPGIESFGTEAPC